jgi:competence ComEA-like helix-hairpin-helix protein
MGTCCSNVCFMPNPSVAHAQASGHTLFQGHAAGACEHNACYRCAPTTTATDKPPLVDVNTASASELAKLPGLNATKADAIVAKRQACGPYRKLWELTTVPGIGEAAVRRLQPLVCSLVDTPGIPRRRLARPFPILPRTSPAAAVIGTWNIQRMSLSKPDFALHVIAGIVLTMDVVAIQEVMDESALAKLLMLLPDWQCVASPPQGAAGSSYSEQYALLYNGSRFRVAAMGVLDGAKCLHESTHPRSHTPKAGGSGTSSRVFTRPPFVVTLADLHTAGALCVVNFHAVYGTQAGVRRQECASLQHAVCALASKLPTEAAFCVVGDFNVASDDAVWQPWGTQNGVSSSDQRGAMPLSDPCMHWDWSLPPGTATTTKGSAYDNVWVRHAHSPSSQGGAQNACMTHTQTCHGGAMPYMQNRLDVSDSVVAAISDHLPVYSCVHTAVHGGPVRCSTPSIAIANQRCATTQRRCCCCSLTTSAPRQASTASLQSALQPLNGGPLPDTALAVIEQTATATRNVCYHNEPSTCRHVSTAQVWLVSSAVPGRHGEASSRLLV